MVGALIAPYEVTLEGRDVCGDIPLLSDEVWGRLGVERQTDIDGVVDRHPGPVANRGMERYRMVLPWQRELDGDPRRISTALVRTYP